MKKPGRDFDYFASLSRLASQNFRAGAALSQILADFSPALAEQALAEALTWEQKGDALRHELLKRLCRDFLPPLEREDLAGLALAAAGLSRCLAALARCLTQYPGSSLPPGTAELGPLLLRACQEWQQAMAALPNFRRETGLRKQAAGISRLAQEGERLLTPARRSLYRERRDPGQLLAAAELYAGLSQCLAACRAGVELAEIVVIKNR